MATSFSVVIALLSLSLVSAFLDKETFEFFHGDRGLKYLCWFYIALILLLMLTALVELPITAHIDRIECAEWHTKAVYAACAVMSVFTFFAQAMARHAILRDRQDQERLAQIQQAAKRRTLKK